MLEKEELKDHEIILRIGVREVNQPRFISKTFLVKLPPKMTAQNSLEEIVTILANRRKNE